MIGVPLPGGQDDHYHYSSMRLPQFAVAIVGVSAIVFSVLVLRDRSWRAGWRLWWGEPEQPRLLVDVLVKCVTIIGVFGAIQFFTLHPQVNKTTSCVDEVDSNHLVALYNQSGQFVPPQVAAALNDWISRRNALTAVAEDVSPLACVARDASLKKLYTDVASSGLGRKERASARSFIGQSSYLTVVYSVVNFGPGDLEQLALVVPSGFTLAEGPGSTINLADGESVVWRLHSEPGNLGLVPDVRINFETDHPPANIPLYAAIALGGWFVFGVVPALLWCGRRGLSDAAKTNPVGESP